MCTCIVCIENTLSQWSVRSPKRGVAMGQLNAHAKVKVQVLIMCEIFVNSRIAVEPVKQLEVYSEASFIVPLR